MTMASATPSTLHQLLQLPPLSEVAVCGTDVRGTYVRFDRATNMVVVQFHPDKIHIPSMT